MDISSNSINKRDNRIEEAFSLANLGYWEFDVKTSKFYWSHKVCDIFGFPNKTQGSIELLSSLISQKDFKKVNTSFNTCLETGQEHHVVYKIIRPNDGAKRWIECHAKRELDSQSGEPIAIYGTVQDITKNILHERQLEDIQGLLHVIRNVSQLVLRTPDKDELIDKICKEIVSLQAISSVWIIIKKNDGNYQWHSYGFDEKNQKIIKNQVSQGNLPICYDESTESIISYEKNSHKCSECIIKNTLSANTDFSIGLWHEGEHYGRIGFTTAINEEDDPYIGDLFVRLSKDIAFSLRRVAFIENANALEKLHTNMFNSALSGVFIHDLEGNLIDVNPAIEKMQNASKEEILKRNISEFYLDGDEDAAKKNFDTLMRNGQVHVKTPLRTIHGKEFYAEIFSSLIQIDDKQFVQGTVSDITTSYEADKKMRQSAAIALSTKEGICTTDAFGKIEYINESFSQITGYTLDELKGKDPSILKSGRHDKEFYKQMWQSIKTEGIWQGEIWNRRKNGQIFPEYLTIRKIVDPANRLEGYVAVFSDLSVKKLSQQKIGFLNTHDPLTKLPNRQNIKEKLDHLINNMNFQNSHILVLSLDIDNFKNINDSLGHAIGDKLLVALVKRIQSILSYRTTLGRLSADEFIIFQKIDSFEQGVQNIQTLLYELQKPFEIDDKQISITISIGATLSSDDTKNAEVLIRNADAAMHKVKEDGKNNYTFFKDEMTRLSYERILMINALRAGIEKEEFILFYQPLQNLDTDKIIGFEALIRWKSSDFGLVAPDNFIPLAEETKLILPLGKWVIKEACRQLAIWKDDKNKRDLTIAINISGVQLYYSNIVQILKKYINHFQINPRLLKLEITESTIMNITTEIANSLEEIKNMGISLSIDDFGTGYSSLARLNKLPVDTLKVDKSFSVNLPQSQDACILSKSILSIAKQMGLNVVIEGIETKEQRAFYKNEKGCILQGYYLAKPMPLNELEYWLEQY